MNTFNPGSHLSSARLRYELETDDALSAEQAAHLAHCPECQARSSVLSLLREDALAQDPMHLAHRAEVEDERLAAFLTGELDEPSACRLRSLLADCPLCQDLCARVARELLLLNVVLTPEGRALLDARNRAWEEEVHREEAPEGELETPHVAELPDRVPASRLKPGQNPGVNAPPESAAPYRPRSVYPGVQGALEWLRGLVGAFTPPRLALAMVVLLAVGLWRFGDPNLPGSKVADSGPGIPGPSDINGPNTAPESQWKGSSEAHLKLLGDFVLEEGNTPRIVTNVDSVTRPDARVLARAGFQPYAVVPREGHLSLWVISTKGVERLQTWSSSTYPAGEIRLQDPGTHKALQYSLEGQTGRFTFVLVLSPQPAGSGAAWLESARQGKLAGVQVAEVRWEVLR